MIGKLRLSPRSVVRDTERFLGLQPKPLKTAVYVGGVLSPLDIRDVQRNAADGIGPADDGLQGKHLSLDDPGLAARAADACPRPGPRSKRAAIWPPFDPRCCTGCSTPSGRICSRWLAIPGAVEVLEEMLRLYERCI
jgi:hypothetical protein